MLVAGLVLVLAWGAFAFGAVYPWGYIPLAIVCALVGIAGQIAGRGNPARTRWAVTAALAAVVAAIAVQIVPLPYELFRELSPAGDAFLRQYDVRWAAAIASNRSPGPSHALSIQPGQTQLALGLFAAFAVFLLGLARGLTGHDARRLAPALIVVGVVLALIGIIQKATYAGRIYGLWQPYAGPAANPFGPFVNRNHFAAWMLMALSLGLGYFGALVSQAMAGVKPGVRNRILWLSSPDASRLLLVGFGLLVMALALVMTLSRSGITCFAIAVALAAAMVAARRRAARSRRAVLLGYLVFLALLSAGWAGVDAVAARFAQADVDFGGRVQAWGDTWRIFRDFPVFGCGMGTFGTAMALYQTANPAVRFTQAHNDYLQTLAEGGLLVAAAGLILVMLLAREAGRALGEETGDETTYWLRAGATTGLLAIALQEVVEFGLQIPGNAALFCALMAVATGRLHRDAPSKEGVLSSAAVGRTGRRTSGRNTAGSSSRGDRCRPG